MKQSESSIQQNPTETASAHSVPESWLSTFKYQIYMILLVKFKTNIKAETSCKTSAPLRDFNVVCHTGLEPGACCWEQATDANILVTR